MSDFKPSAEIDEVYARWSRLSQPYFAWQYQQFAPFMGDRIADVGCGPANLTGFCLGRSLYLGVDLNPAMTGEVKNRFGNHQAVETMEMDMLDESFPGELKKRHIDTVLCLNFLAHVVDEEKALRHMISPLPPGGRLCLLVPAMPGIAGSLEKFDGMLRRYTKEMLRERFAKQPVDILKMRYFNTVGAVGWWLKSRIVKQEKQTNDNFVLMNALIPFLRPIERLMPFPFGLSLIVVAEKK